MMRHPTESRPCELRLSHLARSIGTELEPTQLHQILVGLGFKILQRDGDLIVLENSHAGPGPFREIDVIDAIARVYSYEEIRAQMPTAGFSLGHRDRLEDFKDRIRRVMVSLGYDEALNEGFVSADELRLCAPESLVHLGQSEPLAALRPTLLIELLRNVQHNVSQQVDSLRLFELGKVFQREGAGVREQLVLGAALAGRAKVPIAGSAQFYNLQDMKGCVESLLLELGLRNFSFESESRESLFDPRCSLAIKAKEEPLGFLGAPRGEFADHFGLQPDRVILMELDLERVYTRLLTLSTPVWSELKSKIAPAYPFVRRELCVSLPASTTEGAVCWVLEGEKRVEAVFLSELRTSGDRRIFSYEIIFRDWNKSLSDPEVDEMMARVKQRLVQELRAEIMEP